MKIITGLDEYDDPYTACVGMTADQFEDAGGEIVGDSVRVEQLTGTIAAQLHRSFGDEVMLTPTGPAVTLHEFDPNSVLAWLRANTRVTHEAGDDIPDARVPVVDPELNY